MKPYVVKTPKFVQRLYPKRVWAFPNAQDKVYLTFDDGPIPQVTPWVLDILKEYNAKATFFCIGDNVKKHTGLFRRIYSEGHSIGNHTFNHLNGSKTKIDTYLDNVQKAEEEMMKLEVGLPSNEHPGVKISDKSKIDKKANATALFRPPYGKISQRQASALQKKGYTIVMWDVLSADFDTSISAEKCLDNVLGAIDPGSIVVFHDSLKAWKNVKYTLPKVLEYISEKGWNCEAIEC